MFYFEQTYHLQINIDNFAQEEYMYHHPNDALHFFLHLKDGLPGLDLKALAV